MLKSYFKIAWRNMIRSKGYSALNILGLATGMAVALLIGLWVYYECSYDRFLPGYQQAYQVGFRLNNNGRIETSPATSLPLADVLKKEVPGIRYVAQADWMGGHGLVAGEKKLLLKGAIAGEDFLKIFRYPLLEGNADVVLHDPYSIVLTRSTARSLFGAEEPIGKTVRIDNTNDLKVTGVLEDLPDNSTFRFNYIVPFSYYVSAVDWVRKDLINWRDHSFQTFVALQPNVSYEQVEPQMRMLIKKFDPVDYKVNQPEVFMQPMKTWHLYTVFVNGIATGGLIDYVKMFSIIGILVLLIACINFMNLATARSEKRAREVGIRKAIGSLRKDLIFQFLVESIAITVVAGAISLLFVQLALPSFNALTRTGIHIPFSSPVFWGIMLGYVLLTGLLAGSRPAFYLSSFNPVKVLKSAIQAGRSATLPRKVLVVLQFSCSIALIISTIIIYQQIRHAKDRPTGYDASRLMITGISSDLSHNYTAIKNEMLGSGVVTSVTKASSPVTAIWASQRVDDWQGKLPNESLGLATVAVSDADYFRTLGMKINAGKDFSGRLGEDSLSVILNEAAVKRMRFKEPLNQVITWHDRPQRVRVIGVVRDALMTSPYGSPAPTIFIYLPSWESSIMYRLSPTVNTSDAITKLTGIFNKFNPSVPYEYNFADDNYAAKFSQEVLIGKLAGLFAGLAIFISCLGLLGLAAFMAEQRAKEIGIRKVLGASVPQLWLLLSKDFMLLVIISCIIASPAAYYFLQGWLQKYDYRVSIGPGVFIAAAVLAMVLTLLTISFQAIRAALVNPVKSLKAE